MLSFILFFSQVELNFYYITLLLFLMCLFLFLIDEKGMEGEDWEEDVRTLKDQCHTSSGSMKI
jgi:hypothetical protein